MRSVFCTDFVTNSHCLSSGVEEFGDVRKTLFEILRCGAGTMRLTLRTLLAYLDDLLEPGQSREIGEKISESGYASALVDRIREVMRRRRLTAPDPKSPNSGLDTNSIEVFSGLDTWLMAANCFSSTGTGRTPLVRMAGPPVLG